MKRNPARGVFKDSSSSSGAAFKRIKKRSLMSQVFIGPSVEGTDQEYVKVLSGEVDRQKPSFA